MQPFELIDKRFCITAQIGQGRMGEVYRVTQNNAEVVPSALKMLRDSDLTGDFIEEFELLRRLSHPVFVSAQELGYDRSLDRLYMVMEYIEGQSLETHDDPRDAGDVCLTLLSAIDHLHRHGLVHGDLAPPNVIASEKGFRILDLGASGPIGSGAGTTSGVLAYAAPERLQGAARGCEGDLFSIGATVFRIIYGHHPFPDYPTQLNPEMRPDRGDREHPLDPVLDRLLAYDASDRYPSADAALSAALSVLPASKTNNHWAASRDLPYVKRGAYEAASRRILADLENARGGFLRIGGGSGSGRSRLLREIAADMASKRMVVETYSALQGEPSGSLLRRILSDLQLGFEGLKVVDEAGLARTLARRILHGLTRREFTTVLLVDALEDADSLTRQVFSALERMLAGLAERYPKVQIVASDSVGDIVLQPMSHSELEAWIQALFPGRRVPKSALDVLQNSCHGQPRRLTRAIRSSLNQGILTSDSMSVKLDVARFESLKLPQSETEAVRQSIESLSPEATESLSLLARAKHPLPTVFLGEHLLELTSRDLAVRSPHATDTRWVIATREHRAVVSEQIHSDEEHRRLCECWKDYAIDEQVPYLWHWAHVDQERSTREIELKLPSLSSDGALELIELLLQLRPSKEWPKDPSVGLYGARLVAAQGRMDLAEELLQRISKLPLSPLVRAECHLLKGLLAVRLARLGAAKEHFVAGLDEAPAEAHELQTRLLEGLSRSLVLLGALDEAETGAQNGLKLLKEEDVSLRGRLLYTLGLVNWYRGNLDGADRYLKKALIFTERGGDVVEAAAVITAQGLVAHRRGRVTIASTYYQEAMHMAEEIGDGSRVLTALQNLGVIHHQEGEWKQALDTYQEALAHADAEEQTGRIMQLCGNLGNLWRYLGDLDRAREVLGRGLELAERESNRYMEGLLLTNLGEVELMNETFDAGESLLHRAIELTVETKSSAEELEARLDLGRLYLEQQKFEQARGQLTKALSLATEGEKGAFKARAEALLARSHRESVHGDKEESRRFIEAAINGIENVANLDFRWPIELEACQHASSVGDSSRATKHAQQVLTSLQSLEDSVPADFKERFRLVRERKKAVSIVSPLVDSHKTDTPSGGGGMDSRWIRLLEINKRLTTEKDIRRLLEYIMDSSIILTQAERGFVLLDSENEKKGLEVHVARNIDQENIRNTKFKISHSIASRVIEDGEPILTIDAMEDTRYRDQLSVHDLKLRSVICLPMRMMGRVLGAIYLDNRFQAGAFDVDALAFMENFADQAGIALHNARLVRDLERSKSALESEREKVEELNEKLEEDLKVRTQELAESHKVVIAQQQQLTERHRYDSLIGNSKPLRYIFGIMDRLLDNTIPVLIGGESGTGKELVARAIHFNGKRSKRAFVAINCGAIPGNLLESELFGHVRGAFTGANQDKKGLFEAADGGTLFLDELGELPLEMQVKLLRVLQDGTFKKVGSTSEIQVDVRIIAATNRQLENEIAQGRFREDLYYRLSVVPIQLPPLRDRSDDVPLLVEHFLKKTRASGIGQVKGITPAALNVLKRHDWPGNVRQLEMVLKNVTLFCDNEELDVVDFQSFPDIVQSTSSSSEANLSGRTLADIERSAIIQALHDNHGNKKKSAELLGIDRRTLYNKLKTYNIVIEKELHVT
jgi:serine/threonine-protein kinase PknK